MVTECICFCNEVWKCKATDGCKIVDAFEVLCTPCWIFASHCLRNRELVSVDLSASFLWLQNRFRQRFFFFYWDTNELQFWKLCYDAVLLDLLPVFSVGSKNCNQAEKCTFGGGHSRRVSAFWKFLQPFSDSACKATVLWPKLRRKRWNLHREL
jgi:hypothetical protein